MILHSRLTHRSCRGTGVCYYKRRCRQGSHCRHHTRRSCLRTSHLRTVCRNLVVRLDHTLRSTFAKLRRVAKIGGRASGTTSATAAVNSTFEAKTTPSCITLAEPCHTVAVAVAGATGSGTQVVTALFTAASVQARRPTTSIAAHSVGTVGSLL